MIKIGLIGGSGLENTDFMKKNGEQSISTIYGSPSSAYKVYESKNASFYRLDRHGDDHSLAPHIINYRANIEGFKNIGVERIIAFTAVGSTNLDLKPGDIVIPDNGVDFTNGRESTFYSKGNVRHIDLSYPFCPELRESVIKAADKAGIIVKNGGCYVCTNGPRLETAAEIKFFQSNGWDLVGMTLFPEVALAREREICYLNVSLVTNYAAGIEAGAKLTISEVTEAGRKAVERIVKILENLPPFINEERSCPCKDALVGSGF